MTFQILDGLKDYGRMHWKYNDSNDAIALQAFQSLLILRPADIYDTAPSDFLEKVTERTHRDFSYNESIHEEPYPMLLSCYGAVTMLGEVLHELKTDGKEHPFLDAEYLARQFFNRTFHNNISEIYVDSNGGRQMDLYLWKFDKTGNQTKLFHKVAAGNPPVIQLYGLDHWARATWPPPNEPPCGYNNDLRACRKEEQNTWMIATAVSVAGVICLSVIFAATWWLSRLNANVTAVQTWWIIEPTELEFPLANSFRSAHESKGLTSVFRAQHVAERFSSARLRGIPVLVENITTVAADFAHSPFDRIRNRHVLLRRLNQMLSITHPNILRLYGLTALGGGHHIRISAVTEAPQRGCIYDVFEGLINLDLILISSFITDFLQGVTFIHSSPIGYHGCLCGFHCQIDKHFTLKIGGLINSQLCEGGNGDCSGEPSSTAWRQRIRSVHNVSTEFQQKSEISAVGVILWELLAKEKFTGTVRLAYAFTSK
ncbi:atrial natriuretic peptide receptor 1-like [Paramacrobiotus metropolitanus]|uniref:atrial natriuretic peptide receptor 1-like n=1 Tax=Paramacrobiotus metropolitanus TaxID=2943436 RepID=UPI0024460FF4|nr:atrial natriuretic peptide receptor 1-like [Paramacrobiotus metropolitanus]